MTAGSAPGKIILTGEHAVVYKRPAIAIPVQSVRAEAQLIVREAGPRGKIWISDPKLSLNLWLHEMPEGEPLRQAIQLLQSRLLDEDHPTLSLQLDSSIPHTGGMGSSAAIALAVLRAMSCFRNHPLTLEEQIQLSYETEVIFHGTPSGIDNTVIALNQPVFFEPDLPPLPIQVHTSFDVLIADTGEASQTATAVANVRKLREQNQDSCEALFDEIAEISRKARNSIETGDTQELGRCFYENQERLEELGVSSDKLRTLIQAAYNAGALGAKLSGGGMGGNMIALVAPSSVDTVRISLEEQGAVRVIHTEVMR